MTLLILQERKFETANPSCWDVMSPSECEQLKVGHYWRPVTRPVLRWFLLAGKVWLLSRLRHSSVTCHPLLSHLFPFFFPSLRFCIQLMCHSVVFCPASQFNLIPYIRHLVSMEASGACLLFSKGQLIRSVCLTFNLFFYWILYLSS